MHQQYTASVAGELSQAEHTTASIFAFTASFLSLSRLSAVRVTVTVRMVIPLSLVIA